MFPAVRSNVRARRPHAAILAASAFAVLLLSACTSPEPVDPSPVASATPTPSPTTKPVVSVAFIEDLSSDFDQGRILPAQQGADLGFANAMLVSGLPVSVSLVPFDTGGDPATAAEIVDEIAGDPSYVGALIAPFLDDQGSIVVPLDAAGVPTLSLSSRQPGLARRGLSTWRRLVSTQDAEMRTLATTIDGLHASSQGVCVFHGPEAGEERSWNELGRLLETEPTFSAAAPLSGPPDAAIARVRKAGCGVVVWLAPAEAAAAFRIAMVADGLRSVELVGDDELKADPFLVGAGATADRTIATCPCVDLSTSTELAAQRFIQDYQAEFGSPPAAYSAEAWDAARMLVGAFREGATTRSQVADALRTAGSFDGLANRYVWSPDGELNASAARVHVYRVEGGRWIEARDTPGA